MINDINETAYLIGNRVLMSDGDPILFTPHISVEVFLREKHQINCNCLSRFITSESVADNIKLSYVLANEVIDLLDNLYSDEINNKVGMKGIRIFRALYSYLAYIQFTVYLNLINSIKIVMENYDIHEIFFINKKINSCFYTTTSLNDIFNLFKIKATPLEFEINGKDSLPYYMKNTGEVINHRTLMYRNIYSKIKRWQYVIKNDKTIL